MTFEGTAIGEREHKFTFDRPRLDDYAWRNDRDKALLPSDRLVDWCGKLLLAKVLNNRR